MKVKKKNKTDMVIKSKINYKKQFLGVMIIPVIPNKLSKTKTSKNLIPKLLYYQINA